MLGLPREVRSDEFRACGFIGDHEDLGWPGEQVDAYAAEELALRFGHVRIAGAHEHVDRLESIPAEGQHCECLYATDAVDLVGARGSDRVKDSRMNPG